MARTTTLLLFVNVAIAEAEVITCTEGAEDWIIDYTTDSIEFFCVEPAHGTLTVTDGAFVQGNVIGHEDTRIVVNGGHVEGWIGGDTAGMPTISGGAVGGMLGGTITGGHVIGDFNAHYPHDGIIIGGSIGGDVGLNEASLFVRGSRLFLDGVESWGRNVNPGEVRLTGIITDRSELNNIVKTNRSDEEVWLQYVSPTLDGDANEDGIVDAIDLNILGKNWNQEVPPAGIYGDFLVDTFGGGFVDAADLGVLAGNWQKSVESRHAVPEPVSSHFILLVLLLSFSRRAIC